MLLATGVVLLMSLLSMAIFGVKVAGLTLPHDPASDDVIVTTEEVLVILEPLTQARTELWMEGGLEGLEAAELALETVHDDLLHHGEIRGVEVKLTELAVVQLDDTTLSITGELGVSDGKAMLSFDVAFTVTL
jgi:outer membrane lipoprotein-sorting protein